MKEAKKVSYSDPPPPPPRRKGSESAGQTDGAAAAAPGTNQTAPEAEVEVAEVVGTEVAVAGA